MQGVCKSRGILWTNTESLIVNMGELVYLRNLHNPIRLTKERLCSGPFPLT